MNLRQFRERLEAYRRSADEEASSLKDPYIALERLHAVYEKFNQDERTMADQVFCEWVMSEDEGLRFDALALIDHFKVREAAAALQRLEYRLSQSNVPGAPFERDKVNRVLGELEGMPAPLRS
jgi:hypothetical protein